VVTGELPLEVPAVLLISCRADILARAPDEVIEALWPPKTFRGCSAIAYPRIAPMPDSKLFEDVRSAMNSYANTDVTGVCRAESCLANGNP
jgi:hypothetical protein